MDAQRSKKLDTKKLYFFCKMQLLVSYTFTVKALHYSCSKENENFETNLQDVIPLLGNQPTVVIRLVSDVLNIL